MKHLFIINPAALLVRGKVHSITSEITEFFKAYPDIHYDIYVSAWCRDAVSYIRRYIMNTRACGDEIVRVHTIGGAGTLFEVVNGAVGFSGAQIAAYPYGRTNIFLKYFKTFGLTPFASLHKQVFSPSIPMDVIRCGNNYGICFGLAGLEAYCDMKGDRLMERGYPADLSFALSSIPAVLSKKGVSLPYRVEVDGQRMDGEYLTFFIANTPCYGKNMYPGIEAHPDDGILDIYLHGHASRLEILRKTMPYLKGEHEKIKTILHRRGKKITISSDEVIYMNIDSETFYGTSIEYEVVPGAVQFVCPEGVDLAALPRIYNHPEKGVRGDGLSE